MQKYLYILVLASAVGCSGYSSSDLLSSSDSNVPGESPATLRSQALAALVLKSYAVDLDQNGVLDTNLSIGTCAGDSTHWCILFDSSLAGFPKQISFWPKMRQAGGADVCKANANYEVKFDAPVAIGKHSGGPYQDLSISFSQPEECHGSTVYYRPRLQIFSLTTKRAFAWAQSPILLTDYYSYAMAELSSAWVNPAETGIVRGPSGKFYPYILPGYGDSSQHGAASTYGFMCVFKPGAPGDPSFCGKGFTPVITRPSADYFREKGTYVGDLDGDGWEDVSILFHSQVLTISIGKVMNGQTNVSDTVTAYNVSAADIPASATGGSLAWFHSGRNYGYHSLLKGADGKIRTVMVGAAPVGDHNPFCNVSRFTAVLESSPSNPAGRRLAWSKYRGFNSNIYQNYTSAQPTIARAGDFANECLQVYENGITKDQGFDRIHFNHFLTPQKGLCVAEQYLLYLTNWSPAANAGWSQCLTAKTEASTGSWNWVVQSVETGQSVTGSPNTYVWGVSDKILPGGAPFYILEVLPANVSFRFVDLNLDPSKPLRAQNLVNEAFSQSFALPAAAKRLRPVLVDKLPARQIAADDQPFKSMSLKDVDGDGLMEFQVTDGDPSVRKSGEHLYWVGYSSSQKKLVLK